MIVLYIFICTVYVVYMYNGTCTCKWLEVYSIKYFTIILCQQKLIMLLMMLCMYTQCKVDNERYIIKAIRKPISSVNKLIYCYNIISKHNSI